MDEPPVGTWIAFQDVEYDNYSGGLAWEGEVQFGVILRRLNEFICFVRVVDKFGRESVEWARERIRPLSVLEILAVVSAPNYFDNPDLRLCENEECSNPIDPMKGLYCSKNCALADA